MSEKKVPVGLSEAEVAASVCEHKGKPKGNNAQGALREGVTFVTGPPFFDDV